MLILLFACTTETQEASTPMLSVAQAAPRLPATPALNVQQCVETIFEVNAGSSSVGTGMSGGIGGLIGAQGTQIGSGGLGSRGGGLGGGGTAEGLGGLGTKGSGSSGYGTGAGGYGAGIRARRLQASSRSFLLSIPMAP